METKIFELNGYSAKLFRSVGEVTDVQIINTSQTSSSVSGGGGSVINGTGFLKDVSSNTVTHSKNIFRSFIRYEDVNGVIENIIEFSEKFPIRVGQHIERMSIEYSGVVCYEILKNSETKQLIVMKEEFKFNNGKRKIRISYILYLSIIYFIAFFVLIVPRDALIRIFSNFSSFYYALSGGIPIIAAGSITLSAISVFVMSLVFPGKEYKENISKFDEFRSFAISTLENF